MCIYNNLFLTFFFLISLDFKASVCLLCLPGLQVWGNVSWLIITCELSFFCVVPASGKLNWSCPISVQTLKHFFSVTAAWTLPNLYQYSTKSLMRLFYVVMLENWKWKSFDFWEESHKGVCALPFILCLLIRRFEGVCGFFSFFFK